MFGQEGPKAHHQFPQASLRWRLARALSPITPQLPAMWPAVAVAAVMAATFESIARLRAFVSLEKCLWVKVGFWMIKCGVIIDALYFFSGGGVDDPFCPFLKAVYWSFTLPVFIYFIVYELVKQLRDRVKQSRQRIKAQLGNQ